MSINTFYIMASDKSGDSFDARKLKEYLIVANNVTFCKLQTVSTINISTVPEDELQETEIHFIDGSVLYTNQPLKFINKLSIHSMAVDLIIFLCVFVLFRYLDYCRDLDLDKEFIYQIKKDRNIELSICSYLFSLLSSF